MVAQHRAMQRQAQGMAEPATTASREASVRM